MLCEFELQHSFWGSGRPGKLTYQKKLYFEMSQTKMNSQVYGYRSIDK